MAVAGNASVRESCAQEGAVREAAAGWANVRPLDRSAAGAVSEWVDLLASISHELRTPLNAVIGFSDAMQQEVFGPIGNARYREYVSHIRTSGIELLAAAEDALAMTAVLAQPKAAALDNLPLASLVMDAIADLEARAAVRGVEIVLEIERDLDVRGCRRILPRAVRQMVAVGLSRAAPGARVSIVAVCEHGLVGLCVDVSSIAEGAPSVDQGGAGAFELGLGRREIAVWLATALLDLMDCRLVTLSRDGSLSLRTTLEESSQGSFFSS